MLLQAHQFISAISDEARNFKKGGMIFTFFRRISIFGRAIKADWEARNALGGSGGMLPRKNFDNLHAVMVILVFF